MEFLPVLHALSNYIREVFAELKLQRYVGPSASPSVLRPFMDTIKTLKVENIAQVD